LRLINELFGIKFKIKEYENDDYDEELEENDDDDYNENQEDDYDKDDEDEKMSDLYDENNQKIEMPK
jgi:hypothetical protein